MDVKFKRCSCQDVDDIIELEQLLFEYPFSREMLIFELCHNQLAHYIKVIKDDKIIGYGGIQCLFEEALLMTIGIIPIYQNQGLGQNLLDHLIYLAQENKCNKMILEVATNNEPAIKLYKANNFKESRIRKQYYGHEDAIEMIREIGGSNE